MKPANLLKPTNLNFTSGVLLISMPDVFFLGEERSEAGQVSQPVRADRTSIFFGVKLMSVGVVKFGQVKKIRFVGVIIFSVIF